MKPWLILLAGGGGSRMGAPENKVLLPIRGVPAILRALAPFTGLCGGAVVVARDSELERMRALLSCFGGAVSAVVAGGESRQASVVHGLAAVPESAEIILVHAGARALVTEAVARRAIASAEAHGSGVAAAPVTDTIKRAAAHGAVRETLDRGELYAVQTPQAFRADALREAHRAALRDGFIATDDAALLEHAGRPVYLCEGSRENIKLTTPFDLTLCEAILTAREERA